MSIKQVFLVITLLTLSTFSSTKSGASSHRFIPPTSNQYSSMNKTPEREMLTCVNLESVVDEMVEREIDDAYIPGIVIAIVQYEQVLLEKGYGWADISRQIPVSPEESVFQAGSVSKLFTWTAVMQLVEQGKLDLHTDVNQYLDKETQIAPAFDQPITLADLMAHTAGFEDQVTGIYTRDADELGDLSQFLAANQPNRVHPPGELTSYSNYGTALAAYIVQRVSGQPFAQYMADYIFQPLEMTSTSFQQPVTAPISGQLVSGYTLNSNRLDELPITYTRQLGAGGLTTTAQDISHFMMAYLSKGHFNGAQILESHTVAQMMNRRFTHHPQLMGNVSGFWETAVNQHHILFHTGDTLSFSSMLALLPEKNLGIFIAYNRVADGPRQRILAGLLSQCLDVGNNAQEAINSAAPISSETFSGVYRSVRIDYTTPARLLAFGWETIVHARSDGQLEINGKIYKSIGPELFQQVDGTERVAFRLDLEGRPSHMFFNSVPTMAFEKLDWWETSVLQISALVIPLLIFIISLVSWGISALRKKQFTKSTAHWIAAVMSLLGLLIAGLAGSAMINATAIVYGIPPTLKYAVWLGYPFVLLAALTAGISLALWFRKLWSLLQRLHYTLLALSGLVLVWFLSYWNLLLDFKTLIEYLSI